MNPPNICVTDRIPLSRLAAYSTSQIRQRIIDPQHRIKMSMSEAFFLSSCLSSVELHVTLLENIIVPNRVAVQSGSKSKDTYEQEMNHLLRMSTAPCSFTCISLLNSLQFNTIHQLLDDVSEEEVDACSWLFIDIAQAYRIVKSVKHKREA